MNRLLTSVVILWLLPSVGYCLDPPPITPNDEFFILGIAPEIPSDWTLDIEGEVEQPLSLSLDKLRQLPRLDVEATLECDYSSGPSLLVSSAVWTGVSLRGLLEQAGLKPSADGITFLAIDGYRRGPFPLAEVIRRDDVIVAYNMNGEALPEIQGWPAKIVLPGCVGNQWLRWLDRIEISSSRTGDQLHPWPIHARIFEPEYNAVINKCSYTIKGMVNAGEGKEITKVEVSTDNGLTWNRAKLLNYFIPNVWKHWRYEWDIETPGQYTIFARVTDEEGNVQNEDGLYGWWGYKVVVTVSSEINCLNRERADINKDGYVDFSDFSFLADQWLMSGGELAADVMPNEGDGQVNMRDLMLITDEWLRCFVSDASDPSPADGQENVALTPVLIWLPQEDSAYNDVYFGMDPGSIATATHDSEEFLGSVLDNRFALEQTLEPNTVYYWRIDRIGSKCTKFGDIWSFRTMSSEAFDSGPPGNSTDIDTARHRASPLAATKNYYCPKGCG
jgi:DMSO/TMAO reductase YedYZ molybdopterin-dependent catalytic subunit